MKLKQQILILILFLATPALGQEFTVDKPAGKNLWKISMVSLAATNAMDIQSSWGKRELNGTLAGSAGRFDGKGALIKIGIVGGVSTIEFLVLRRQPRLYRKLAFINFGEASVTGGMAIRNYGISAH